MSEEDRKRRWKGGGKERRVVRRREKSNLNAGPSKSFLPSVMQRQPHTLNHGAGDGVGGGRG